MKTARHLMVVLALVAAVSTPAYCWDKYGHMLIAEVAYESMTPAARTQVDSILSTLAADPHVSGLEDKYRPYNAVTVAAWMDDMRMSRTDTAAGHTAEFNTWHYIDLPDGAVTAAEVKAQFDKTDAPNAYEVLVDKCMKAINDPSMAAADRVRYIGMFFHLAGDIHQPLHAIGRLKGGNDYKIDPLPAYDPGPDAWHISNLHAFWDNAYRYDGIDGQVKVVCPYLDMPRTIEPGKGDAKVIVDTIILPYLPTDKAKLAEKNPAVWAVESHDVATSFAFPKDNGAALSADYVHRAHVIACARMALAGWRMAQVLNAAFK